MSIESEQATAAIPDLRKGRGETSSAAIKRATMASNIRSPGLRELFASQSLEASIYRPSVGASRPVWHWECLVFTLDFGDYGWEGARPNGRNLAGNGKEYIRFARA